MSEFVISREQFEASRNTICQFLRDAGYEGSLEDGTGIADALIKPAALVTLFLRQELRKAGAYQSLQQASELKPTLSADEYDAAVDAILSNWFVQRKDGLPGNGVLRLWFSQPTDFMRLRKGVSIGEVNSEDLVVSEDTVLSRSSFTQTTNGLSIEYYTDVRVQTARNTSTPILTGDPVTADVADIFFLRGTIPADFVPGIPRESSEALITRSQWAITTRELISEHAIRTVLLDEFDEIHSIYIARHGSSEQRRDIIEFHGLSVHVGNKADIYLSLPLTRFTTVFVPDDEGKLDLSLMPVNVPPVDFLGAHTADGTPCELAIHADPLTWASPRTPLLGLSVPQELAGQEVTVEWVGSPALLSIYDFVYSKRQRVTCYDPIVRHKHLVHFGLGLEVDFIDGESIERRARVREVVANYITGLVDGAVWTESEMVKRIHGLGFVSRVSIPVVCNARLFNTETGSWASAAISDRFDLHDLLPVSPPQITINTVQPWTDATLITVNGEVG